MKRLTARPGFTLIELLVVIAIIGVLAAIAFPVISKVRERADSATCVSNLRQLAITALKWANDHDASFWTTEAMTSSDGSTTSWYNDIKSAVPADDLNKMLQCPGYRKMYNPSWAPWGNSYSMNSDLDGDGKNWTPKGQSPLSKTVGVPFPSLIPFFFDSVPPNPKNPTWVATYRLYKTPETVGDCHPGGTHNVVFVDGHVETRTRADIPAWEKKLQEKMAQ